MFTPTQEGESTTDVVFGGHNLIAENGTILKASRRFANETIYSEIDIKRLLSERRKIRHSVLRQKDTAGCSVFRQRRGDGPYKNLFPGTIRSAG